MQNGIYILLFQFIICGFKSVNAFIGHNIRSARENEFLSVVCISVYNPSRTWQQNMKCTGTLISNNFVLSAGHCFERADRVRFEIGMGSHMVEDGIKYYPVWWITYDQWANAVYENYVRPLVVDDLLLIKIFGIWRDITPSRLQPINPVSIMYGIDVLMVGCGKLDSGYYPTTRQVAGVKVLHHRTCETILSILEQRNVTLGEKFFCSKGTPYTQMYSGDSGGPLVYYGSVIGINIACSPRLNDEFNENRVNIHVNIDIYQPFISAVVIPGY